MGNGIKDHISRHLCKCWGERGRGDIFRTAEQRAKTSRTNTQDAIEEKGEKMADRPACGFSDDNDTTNITTRPRVLRSALQADLHSGHKALHSLPSCQTLSRRSVSVMLTAGTCAALFTDKRQTKTTQRANAAGWATATAAPATQVNAHLVESQIQHRAQHISHFKNSSTFHCTMHSRRLKCARNQWESALSGPHAFSCNCATSQSTRETLAFLPYSSRFIEQHSHVTESFTETQHLNGTVCSKMKFYPFAAH